MNISSFLITTNLNAVLKDEEGRTPLSHETRDENVEIATVLLGRGADVNSVDEM